MSYNGALRSIRSYGYFLSCYLAGLVGVKKPILGGMKLTHRCNLTCSHCPFWEREKSSLSFVQTKDSMRTLHEWGVRILILEGGEPFLWKDGTHSLDDVVKEAKRLFYSVGITTNGTFPLETDADTVWVSVDGMKGTHDRIRGESFEKAIGNIERSSHPSIYAHITINALNWQEIPELVQFLEPRVKGITIQFHYPYKSGEDGLFLPFEQRRVVLDELIALKRRGLPLDDSYACLTALKDNNWRCRPWLIASVEPDGRVARGCYVEDRGEVSCEHCGFAAHTEISLAFSGVPGAILAGKGIFGW